MNKYVSSFLLVQKTSHHKELGNPGGRDPMAWGLTGPRALHTNNAPQLVTSTTFGNSILPLVSLYVFLSWAPPPVIPPPQGLLRKSAFHCEMLLLALRFPSPCSHLIALGTPLFFSFSFPLSTKKPPTGSSGHLISLTPSSFRRH